MLSMTSRYALRALAYLATHPDRQVFAHEIAAETDIPTNYLSKILHTLARQGLVKSGRGRRGGFRLALPPDRIVLKQVIAPFENPEFPRDCLLGRPFCSDNTPCQAHAAWKPISEQVSRFFQTATLADLIRREAASTSTAAGMD